MATRLIFIRHGVTEWNKKRRYCGWRDVSLSREGMVQAEKLRRRFRSFPCDGIYSSDRKRALQTARIVFGRVKITKIRGLREINFGAIEGMSHKEIMVKFPQAYKRWLKDPFGQRMPKAETLFGFSRRVRTAIREIVRLRPDKTVVVVCHGGTIGILISGILKKKDFWHRIPATASVTIVDYKWGRPKIKLFNDVSHLR